MILSVVLLWMSIHCSWQEPHGIWERCSGFVCGSSQVGQMQVVLWCIVGVQSRKCPQFLQKDGSSFSSFVMLVGCVCVMVRRSFLFFISFHTVLI